MRLQRDGRFYLKPERGMRSMRVHLAPFLGTANTLKGTGISVKNFGMSVGIGFPVGASSEDES